MELQSDELEEAYSDFTIGFMGLKEQFPGINENDLTLFFVNKAGEGQNYLDRTVSLFKVWGREGITNVEYLVENGVEKVRKTSLDILGELVDPKSIKTLINALGAWETDIRNQAIKALVNYTTRSSAVAIIDNMGNHKDWRIRYGLTKVIQESVNVLEDLIAKFGERLADDMLEIFETNLEYKEPRVRSISAKILGHFKIEKVRGSLEKTANTNSEEVAVAGIEALVLLGGEKSLKYLEKLILKKKLKSKIKIAALSGIGRLSFDKHSGLEGIIKLRNDSDPNVRKKLAWALGSFPTDETVKILVTMLGDPEEPVRNEATNTLIDFGRSVVPVILDQLFDKKTSGKFKSHIRSSALQILPQFDIGPYILDLISHGLLNDPDPAVRASVVNNFSAVKKRDRREISDVLMELAIKENDNLVLVAIAKQLPTISGSASIDLLVDLLHDKKANLEVKNQVVQGLNQFNWTPEDEEDRLSFALATGDYLEISNIKTRKAINFLGQLLDNQDKDIRLNALDLLIDIDLNEIAKKHRKKILKKIRVMAKKEDDDVRSKSIPILGYLRDNESQKQLSKYWETGSDKIRNAVIYAYDLWQDNPGTRGLISIIPDATEEEIEVILDALTHILLNKDNVKIMTGAFKNPNLMVRKYTSQAVVKIASPLFIPFLKKELDSEFRFVRHHAAEALKKMSWEPSKKKERINYHIALKDWETLETWNIKNKMKVLTQELEFSESTLTTGVIPILIEYKQSIKHLRKMMKNSSESVKLQIIIALGYHNINNKAIQYIFPLFEDESPIVRQKVAEVIGETNHHLPGKVNKILKKLIFDKDPNVVEAAAKSYSRVHINYLLPDILDKLKEGSLSNSVKDYLVEALRLTGDNAIKPMIDALDTKYDDLVDVVTRVLPKIEGPQVEETLYRYLNKGKPIQVACVATALSKIDKDRYYRDIILLLNSDKASLRLIALKAVGTDIPEDKIGKYIIPKLKDEDIKIRYEASINLINREWKPKNEHEELLLAHANGDWEKVAGHRTDIGELQVDMEEALTSQIPDLVTKTAISMAKLSGTAFDVLADMLFSEDTELALTVREQFLDMGQNAAHALTQAYDRFDETEKRSILLDVMKDIGGVEIEEKLSLIINDKSADQTLRMIAMEVIAPMDSKAAIPILVKTLGDDNKELAQLAADELVDLGELSVQELLKLLVTTNEEMFIQSAQILGRVRSQNAIPQLQKYIRHSNLSIRHAAGLALYNIGWKPIHGSDEQVDFLIAIEKWDRVLRLGNSAMGRLIEIIQNDPNVSVTEQVDEIMRTIWPGLPAKSKENYEKSFRRLLGPRAPPIFEYLIDFGYEKPKVPILKKIYRIVKSFVTANLYYLFAIATAFIIVTFVNNQYSKTAAYAEIQFILIATILVLQFAQSVFITNYGERFIKIMENVAGVFKRGKRVTIWANRHFPLIVGLIFISTLYKIMTTEPGDIKFVEDEESIIGKILIGISTGRYLAFAPNVTFSFPSFRITEWFGIIDLPTLDIIFDDTKLSLILRGIIFLAIAIEVYRNGAKAIYQQNTIPNDPPKFYQKFALPIGLLIFYMLAFVEESKYEIINEQFSEVPVHASRLGILVGSFIYLLLYSKDKPLGWITVYLAIPTYALIKLLEVILVPNAIDPFGVFEKEVTTAFITLLIIIPITFFINKILTDKLLHSAGYASDSSTINFIVKFSWRIWFTTYVFYGLFVTLNFLPSEFQSIALSNLAKLPTTILLILYLLWLLRMLKNSVLRRAGIFSLLPVFGLFYLIWGRQQSNPNYLTQAMMNIEGAINSFIAILVIIPLIIISLTITRRTFRMAKEEADLEGIDKKIERNIRISLFFWVFYLIIYALIFGVEMVKEIQNIFNK